jgi:hypothetical protein
MLFSIGIRVTAKNILQDRYGYEFSHGLLEFCVVASAG